MNFSVNKTSSIFVAILGVPKTNAIFSKIQSADLYLPKNLALCIYLFNSLYCIYELAIPAIETV